MFEIKNRMHMLIEKRDRFNKKSEIINAKKIIFFLSTYNKNIEVIV